VVWDNQICTEYAKKMVGVAVRAGIDLPDRQLACATDQQS